MNLIKLPLLLILALSNFASSSPFQASGIKIGEVTENSAIIWTRCTTVATPDPTSITAAAPGMSGEVRVSWTPEGGSQNAGAWTAVDSAADFTRQVVLSGLAPATRYSLTVETRPAGGGSVSSTLAGSFRSAPAADSTAPVTAVIVTGQGIRSIDHALNGHKVYSDMDAIRPDWFAHTGDVLYYDNDTSVNGNSHPLTQDITEARQRWNRMFAYNWNQSFHLNTPTYYLKDDHDTLKNDCWPGQSYNNLTWAQALAVNREQIPIGSGVYYRTLRWGRDLQVWFLEGREYRSANTDPDGPNKTILGQAQKDWLMSTLAASDATFKVVVSPTPVVGPNGVNRADNHANPAFKTEGDWLRSNLASIKNCYVVCGDRHWQYGSIDPTTSLREYCCGPINEKHSVGYDYDPSMHTFLASRGGYLMIRTERIDQRPQINFAWYDIDITDPETGLAKLAYEETIRDEDFTNFTFSYDHNENTVTFRFMTEVGYHYGIEESSDMPANSWLEIASNLPSSAIPTPGPSNPIPNGTLFTHTINLPENYTRRFFRLTRHLTPETEFWPETGVLVDTTAGNPNSFNVVRRGIKEGRSETYQTLTFAKDSIITDLWLVVSGGEDGSPGQVYFDHTAITNGDFTVETAPADNVNDPSIIRLSGLNVTVTAGLHSIGLRDTGVDPQKDFVFGWHYLRTNPYSEGEGFRDDSPIDGDFGIAVGGTESP